MIRHVTAVLCLLAVAACPAKREPSEGRPPAQVKPDPIAPRTADAQAIQYTIRFPDAHAHYMDIEAVYPAKGKSNLELMMAVWTPGSYLVREYSRHVEALTAQTVDGKPLSSHKHRKNRWRVTTGGADRVAVKYRVYGREMTVRTNFVDTELAIINGAPTFITIAGELTRPYDVKVELPSHYKRVITSLTPHDSGDANRFVAADFDTLVDTPIVCGTPDLHRFDVQGVPHTIANFGSPDVWQGKKAADDVKKLVATQTKFWGVIPYRTYVFLNIVGEVGGGLEHKDSTLMMTGRWMSTNRKDYLKWLGLASHEFFHTWNVKRLRPVELGPFDYESEVHTTGLWIAEGLTSYYDDLLLVRAGLMKRDELLERLSSGIKTIETTPGARVQSLARGSFDAWIKHYRRNENSPNTAISYYTKGAIVGFLLDAHIRRVSQGKASLDDVMRAAYNQYSGAKGYTSAEFRALASRIAGADLSAFFTAHIDTPTPLDYAAALNWYGLRFAPEDKDDKKGEPAGWLGADLTSHGNAKVRVVRRGTPAHRAGLNVGDELVAMGGYRVTADSFDSRLARYRPKQKVVLTIARRGRMMELPVTLGDKPADAHKVEVVPTPTPAQTQRLNAWLAP